MNPLSPLVALALSSLTLAEPPRTNPFAASDWVSAGTDCRLFAAGDLNADGFTDVLTINSNRDLCVALSVRGWKAAGWVAIADDVNPDAKSLAIADFDADSPGLEVAVRDDKQVVLFSKFEQGRLTSRTTIDADSPQGLEIKRQSESAKRPASLAAAASASPPYDPNAKCLSYLPADFTNDGVPDLAFVFDCTLPHPYRALRVLVSPNPNSQDPDADSLTNDEEKSLATDPLSRDTDGDGLLDGWEVKGLPRNITLGDSILLFDPKHERDAATAQLNPRRQDVIVNISYFEGVDPAQFAREMPRVRQSFREINSTNHDGSTGIFVHFRVTPGFVSRAEQGQHWWTIGNRYFPAHERGLMHWMQVTPFGGGQSGETADMGGCGNGWHVFAHEFGHQMGLSHTGDSAPGWCPLYTSMMNYAYHYSFDGDGNKSHFSTGAFRDAVLNERHLTEKLNYPIDRLRFLSNHPFRFPLKDNGDGTTLIDWNQNGAFDDGTVEADINYGGSTQAGERHTHTLIGSAPSIAYINGVAMLAVADHKQTAVTIKSFKSGKDWTNAANVPDSSSRFDPVLIGGPDFGVILIRRFDAWTFAKVSPGETPEDPPSITHPTALKPLPLADISGIRIGDRILLLSRHDDNSIERRWLSFPTGDKRHELPTLSEPVPLDLKSQVPPGLTLNPADATITVSSANIHENNGPFCLQLSSLTINANPATPADEITQSQALFTHAGRLIHCTTRPVPVYHQIGTAANGVVADAVSNFQLVIFHTGWPDANGCWTAWRTTRIGNKALDDGWITSQLYDEWTRSRVALAFADGPQGTHYAFRWDPGDHRDWKVNTLFVAHNGYGIDDQPMRDFNDAAKMSLWGIRQSILNMRP